MCKIMSIRRQENNKETMLGHIASICEEMRYKQRNALKRPISHEMRSKKTIPGKSHLYGISKWIRVRTKTVNGKLMRMASALKGNIYR